MFKIPLRSDLFSKNRAGRPQNFSDRLQKQAEQLQFIGTEWFEFLIANKIPFVIRIKQNSNLKTKEGHTILAGMLRKYLGRKKIVNYFIILWSHFLYLCLPF